MERLLKTLVLLAAPVSFWCLSTSASLAGELWEGSGRIIRGAGKGASVPVLQLETETVAENMSVLFLTGPDAGELLPLTPEDSVVTPSGTWQFLRSEDELEVNFYQNVPYRVIHYRLNHSNHHASATQSSKTEGFVSGDGL